MTKQVSAFNQITRATYRIPCAVCLSLLLICDAFGANVVARGTSSSRVGVSRPTMAGTRSTTTRTKTSSSSTTTTTTQETSAPVEEEPEQETEPTEPVVEFEFEDKSGTFDNAIGSENSYAARDADDEALAEKIRRQREALDAAAASTVRTTTTTKTTYNNASANSCDNALRQCMQTKCGNDFSKCSGDTDTMWGTKMDACRRDTQCTGHEYQLFAAEIKADRDANAELANFNAIIDCGNDYNDCIITHCGQTFSKCLGKTAGDLAISKCDAIAKRCVQMDGGFASRTLEVFGYLRQDAEKQIQRDEQRLYELRDKMESTCRGLGALFDQRSLDCVFTVNFFANNSTTPYASKKAYAGSTFDCDQNWFGINVTTFKENAYRLTRGQTSASAAMLGSGLGIATGAITSGAIDRAVATHKAKKAYEQAQEEHSENYGDGIDLDGDGIISKKEQRRADRKEKRAERQANRAEKRAERQANREARKQARQEQKNNKNTDGDTTTPLVSTKKSDELRALAEEYGIDADELSEDFGIDIDNMSSEDIENLIEEYGEELELSADDIEDIKYELSEIDADETLDDYTTPSTVKTKKEQRQEQRQQKKAERQQNKAEKKASKEIERLNQEFLDSQEFTSDQKAFDTFKAQYGIEDYNTDIDLYRGLDTHQDEDGQTYINVTEEEIEEEPLPRYTEPLPKGPAINGKATTNSASGLAKPSGDTSSGSTRRLEPLPEVENPLAYKDPGLAKPSTNTQTKKEQRQEARAERKAERQQNKALKQAEKDMMDTLETDMLLFDLQSDIDANLDADIDAQWEQTMEEVTADIEASDTFTPLE